MFAAAGIGLISSSLSVADDAAGFPAPPAFAEVDSNGDLQISREEFETAMEQRMSASEGKMRRLGDRFLRAGPEGDNPPGFGGTPAFAELDSNGDLIVTEEEFNVFMEERASMPRVRCRCIGDGHPFDRADADGDGVLSQEEYDGMMEKVRLRGGD
jgi:hypothetical protein